MERRSFLDQEPPPGYIAGIGRGAVGFTTRSDVGNARLPPQQRDMGSDDEDNFEDIQEGGLLSLKYGELNKDDEEAEAIYREVEERLNTKNKRKVRIDEEQKDESNLSKISSQFVDLKKDLASISEEQWASLPEVGDLTKRNKRLRKIEQEQQKTYVAPDSLLSGLNNQDSNVNLGALTSQREKLLGSKIDANFDWDKDQTIDSSSYLNTISNLPSNNEEEVKKMRKILNSYTKSDPFKPEGWIARARLEEFNKNFENAKKLIEEGCSNCPQDEDIWLENVRLNRLDLKYSKIIIANAVKSNSKSLKLWFKASELEQESFNKLRILRKALESIPTSKELWLKLIELEDNKDDKIKIALKSTEIISKDEELWLTLINLQPYKDAKNSLNKARKILGNNNVSIWMTACELESINEADSKKVEKLVSKAFKECDQTREEWFSLSIKFEKKQLVNISEYIIKNIYLKEEDIEFSKMIEDANKYQEHIYTYKIILNLIVEKFPKKTVIWKRIILLYQRSFSIEELYQTFENIISTVPKNPLFWLMYSKEVWKNGDILKAKNILNRAFEKIDSNVDIWLALIKLETIENNFEKVESLFNKAKSKINNERIWYKHVTFLRSLNKINEALEVVNDGLLKFNTCFKLYIQKSQILEGLNKFYESREILSIGTKAIPESTELWILLSRIDHSRLDNVIRARSDLDLAILKNPKSDKLWFEKLLLENKLNNINQISGILTKSLKEFPESSLLWSFNLKFNTKKSLRKTLYKDALSATKNNVRILLIIGYNFWTDGKLDKSKNWFQRALELDEDFGDSWAWYYNFLTRTNEPKEVIEDFLTRFKTAEPHHGDIWPIVCKQIENTNRPLEDLLRLTAERVLNES